MSEISEHILHMRMAQKEIARLTAELKEAKRIIQINKSMALFEDMEREMTEYRNGIVAAVKELQRYREALEAIAHCNYKNSTEFQQWALQALKEGEDES